MKTSYTQPGKHGAPEALSFSTKFLLVSAICGHPTWQSNLFLVLSYYLGPGACEMTTEFLTRQSNRAFTQGRVNREVQTVN